MVQLRRISVNLSFPWQLSSSAWSMQSGFPSHILLDGRQDGSADFICAQSMAFEQPGDKNDIIRLLVHLRSKKRSH